jgi:hypothetical protein
MASNRSYWKVGAILWEDAASAYNPMVVPCPVLSFGVPLWDKEGKFWRVFHDLYADGGGMPDSTTAVPRGMSPKVIALAKLPVPEEFKKYWERLL